MLYNDNYVVWKERKNMMFSRSSGVLMNISSLPSKYGIGVFNEDAVKFGKFMLDAGFHYWQMLPLTTVGQGNSPYSGVSAFAGNYLYIDADTLVEEGVLDKADAEATYYKDSMYTTDYDNEYKVRRDMLEKAMTKGYPKYKREIGTFLAEHEWLRPYAEYMTLRSVNDAKPWWEWDSSLSHHDTKAVERVISKNRHTYEYYIFEQYIFHRQWMALKERLNSMDISIIGDMPIYVSLDSADVWSHQDMFDLDENGKPRGVAGVPPDYFSHDGQLWGNPLYDVDYLRDTHFAWWADRFDRMFELYDVLRIDHFRAFDRYWRVEAGAKTAKEGKWVDGVGRELFDTLHDMLEDKKIIAEDLGIIDDGVRDLLAYTGFPGMRVMQFGFSDGDSIHLPHNFDRNVVGYTATHDNNTSFGWMYELDENVRAYTMQYIGVEPSEWCDGGYSSKSVHAFIKKLIESSANLAIVPFQDLCGYGGDTRMNIPGVADKNWRYRTTWECIDSVDVSYFRDINNLYGRNRK